MKYFSCRLLRRFRFHLAIFALCIANLLFVHYYFRATYQDGSEYLVYIYHWATNFALSVFDVILCLFFFLLLSGRRLRFSLSATFLSTWLWSASNIVYSRFFHQYISLSAIGEFSSLADGMVFKSAMSGFRLIDSFYIVVFVLFLIFCRKAQPYRIKRSRLLWPLALLVMMAVSPYPIYTVYHFVNPSSRHNWELYKIRIKDDVYCIMPKKECFPNVVRFQWGFSMVNAADMIDAMKSTDLDKEKIDKIAAFKHKTRVSGHKVSPSISNVVFIILESFLSAPIDLRVDGKEVTPFLNALKSDSTIYYNGRVNPNITIGESGDGQFIYMTGLLPLRSKITVGLANHCSLPGLPRLLKEKCGIKRTEIIIPGLPTVWRQDEMNVAYGIDHLISASEKYGRNDITDKEVFDLAMHSYSHEDEPFLSIVLSCSTHLPYNTDIDTSFIISTPTLPDSYKHYLNACHFADEQIGRYITDLKKKGLYDKSLIIITADHDAHLNLLGMEGQIKNHLPLFIINGDIDKTKAWHEEMNQIDIYTTLLDILGIKSDWMGVGNTILMPNYKDPMTDDAWNVSQWIIESNYFSQESPNSH